MALPYPTAYHMFPSGPAVIPNGYEPVAIVSPGCPSSPIAPTMPASFSVNHRPSPAGLGAIAAMPLSVGTGYSVIVPSVVILPTL